jgi:homoserine O-acetyltransferase
MESILESSDDFYSDLYSDSLSRMMVSINKLLYSNYFSKKMFQTMSNDEIDVLMDDFVDEGLFVDVYDFKFRNDCVMEYNVEDKLGNITADALIISSNNDMYYTPEFDLLPLNDLMKNVTVVLFEDENSYFDYDDCSIVETEINSFMEKIKNK